MATKRKAESGPDSRPPVTKKIALDPNKNIKDASETTPKPSNISVGNLGSPLRNKRLTGILKQTDSFLR